MLAISGIMLLAASGAIFVWTLRRGIYRRYPWEQFVLVASSATIGLFAVVATPGVLPLVFLLVELVALGAFTWYMTIGARFPRGSVKLEPGDRMPAFQLPDSEGGTFDSAEIVDRSPALYLFYRGDW